MYTGEKEKSRDAIIKLPLQYIVREPRFADTSQAYEVSLLEAASGDG